MLGVKQGGMKGFTYFTGVPIGSVNHLVHVLVNKYTVICFYPQTARPV